jgi:hypothetical protein
VTKLRDFLEAVAEGEAGDIWHYQKNFSQAYLNLYHTRAENDITFSFS